ncbi:MAG: c-type cytochrome [Elusimicrobiota bacterium]|nr:c-type cytochrome [Elusimicrobiota bacterium]
MDKKTILPGLFFLSWVFVPAPLAAEEGKALFEEHCAACHTVGGGDSVGPDLKGVSDHRRAGWLKRVIIEPDRLTAESDPEQLALVKKWGMEMPNLGISPEKAVEILEYLVGGHPANADAAASAARQGNSVKQTGAVSNYAASEAKPAGSAANGRELFTGLKRLSAGGPACAGCHSISPGNMAAGGSYAVSLVKTFDKLGGSGIKAVLTRMPFPVKAAAFKGRPVTEGEIADLAAFLEEAGKAGPEAGAGFGKLAFAGLSAAAFALILIALAWSGRKKKGVKDEILSRQARTY